ncbi:hypothetical protein HF086_010830 [Spodoptera exigua]|uniref:Uncharacterized protein n=1 Tax=Spodoptera exigua TaxID=7107 RepID=A0A922M9R4_SPOEX|nr:hypothetical protein HF086_010830 [Spodoptera exigua]
MAPHSPVTLLGDTLGQRHRHLNSLVRAARESGTTVQDVEAVPEQSPADRLFKIDLAVSLRDTDYIIQNLKHDDMLFVSRALKARWLLDRHDVINPKYLEETLFPEMISPAVTKMRHWLYINLREPPKCLEFYEYYKQNSFEFAIKFLSHCNSHVILEEVPKILAKLSPHYLKVLCERCPAVAKIYFDALAAHDDLKSRYLEQEQSYYNSIKCVLKSDADVFLDITEEYFSFNNFKRFSPLATDYIVRNHKSRVMNKLGLYVAHILHIPTLAVRLSVDECQDVVLQLARATYLQHWFQYKAVEPLIKRLHPQKRAAFKKRVFVDKDVGELIKNWPYKIPTSPMRPDISGPHIFDDQDFVTDIIFEPYFPLGGACAPMAAGMASLECVRMDCYQPNNFFTKIRTDLDRLFDEFRFIGFDRAVHELSQRLVATASPDRRRDIFLVLVSKTGGRTDAVKVFMQLALRHGNEPAHTRASVIRSLVKRAAVWRLPADVWQLFLDYGHGLGLDGTTPEAACREGLHAVVIRQLLVGHCEPAICDAFSKDFSTLTEYSLQPDEKVRIATNLQNMLASTAVNVEPEVTAQRLSQLLDVLNAFRIRIEASSLVVNSVLGLAGQDQNVARPLLERLYNAKIARRELLRLSMTFRRDEAALLNALRHDPLALDVAQVVNIMYERHTKFDNFTAKLVVYFGQKHDFTTQLKNALKERILKQTEEDSSTAGNIRPLKAFPPSSRRREPTNNDMPNRFQYPIFPPRFPLRPRQPRIPIFRGQKIKLIRPLASLIYQELEKELKELDQAGSDYTKMAAEMRACGHRARPIVNLAEWGWSRAGVKAVATRVMRCREVERAEFIRTLAAERRTVRVALALSLRSERGPVLDTFTSFAQLRPAAALRAALHYFRRRGSSAELGVWNIIKPLLSTVDLMRRERLRRLLENIQWIPSPIKPDYCINVYLVINKISRSAGLKILRELSRILPQADESIDKVLLDILDSADRITPAVFIRYLMLSVDDEDLEKRLFKVGNRFLEYLNTLHRQKNVDFPRRLNQVLVSLQYNAAFFDTKYSCCMKVFEVILGWVHTFTTKERDFKIHAQVNLLMLYYKAIRQCMQQLPEVFADAKRKRTEGVEAVGLVFGRYIMMEVVELVTTYFDSMIELYSRIVNNFMDYFTNCASRSIFIKSTLKGMWEEGVGIQRRMVVYLYRDRGCFEFDNSIKKEIEELLTQEKAVECFVYTQ